MGWLLSLGLCLAGLAAILIEFFVPAGIIGVVGFGSIVTGIVLAFVGYGTTVGMLFLVGAVLATPAVIALYFKFFPKSFVGKWLILGGERKTDEGSPSDVSDASGAGGYSGLEGREGTTVTALRPSGAARIDGVKHSVVTGGEFIEKGEPVVVTRVEGSRIVVRKGE